MASILDRYGIKEVADVTFYKINSDGTPGAPVLFLDTLKVSTIEQTAEQVDARGGKGNPKLITWDYGKEITLTLEDALFSPKSMAIMMGDGNVAQGTGGYIRKTAVARLGTAVEGKVKLVNDYITADIYDATEGSKRVKLYLGGNATAPAGEVKINGQLAFSVTGETSKLYDEDGVVLDSTFTESDLKLMYTTGLDVTHQVRVLGKLLCTPDIRFAPTIGMYTNAICAARLEKDALELLGVRRFEHDVAAACARCPLVKVARSRA